VNLDQIASHETAAIVPEKVVPANHAAQNHAAQNHETVALVFPSEPNPDHPNPDHPNPDHPNPGQRAPRELRIRTALLAIVKQIDRIVRILLVSVQFGMTVLIDRIRLLRRLPGQILVLLQSEAGMISM